jgi:hypothetical protein
MGTRPRAPYRAAAMRDAVMKERRAYGAGDVSVLRCPLCGLTVARRASWVASTHRPRCVAGSQTIVELSDARKA